MTSSGALLDVFDEVAGDIHAGDLVLVLLGKGNHLLGGVPLLHREGRVDIDLVRRRDGVQHLLQGIEVGQRLAAGEDEVARGRDFIHRADAAQDRPRLKPVQSPYTPACWMQKGQWLLQS